VIADKGRAGLTIDGVELASPAGAPPESCGVVAGFAPEADWSAAGSGGGGTLVEQRHHLQRQREDDGGVLLHADLGEGLQVAQLQGHGLRGHQRGGVHQLGAALNSPSAWMILARRSRSASACLAMARSICSGRSTCLTSTETTLTPKGSVAGR
jgi:hypothetical protein